MTIVKSINEIEKDFSFSEFESGSVIPSVDTMRKINFPKVSWVSLSVRARHVAIERACKRVKNGLITTWMMLGSMESRGSWVTGKRKGRKWPNLRIDLRSLLFHFQDICKGIDVARRKGNALRSGPDKSYFRLAPDRTSGLFLFESFR